MDTTAAVSMNDNINMDTTTALSINAHNKLTTS